MQKMTTRCHTVSKILFCLFFWPRSVTFCKSPRNPMILLILVFHTLLALLSCPPFALGVTLHLTQINFYSTVCILKIHLLIFIRTRLTPYSTAVSEWIVQYIDQNESEMSNPGFEPGLPRPQRGVLTARRIRQLNSMQPMFEGHETHQRGGLLCFELLFAVANNRKSDIV